ncbi:MAG: EFR1 family ferrodoxin [Syntrophomonadaceae bacterium]|nr:EFR1 family ferrodoxin [Syntrophomonadaceae bacterium]
MKIESLKLVYFSPTGTTKTIIEGIAHGINLIPVETIDISKPEARKQQLQTSENELLVIGVPVYAGRVPTIALDWLCTIKARSTPTVCIVVYGNREYDDALLELKDTMAGHGCVPIAYAAFIGEHSFSSSETPIAVARPDVNDVKQAKLFGERINEKLMSIASANHIADITVPGSYPYRESTPWIVDFIAINDECSQCGACVEVCPVDAIDLENSALIDIKKCILCCACIKNCPEKALTMKTGLVKKVAISISQTCQNRKEPVFFL